MEGPITSHYRWEEKCEVSREYRLMFKCLPETLLPLETYVLSHHPYATPEWIAVKVERVSEKYLSWARADVHSRTL